MPEAKKKRTYRGAAAYVLLLTAALPFNILYLITAVLNGENGKYKVFLGAYGVLAVVYCLAVLCLGLVNMAGSFLACGRGDSVACINRMLILKYGLVPFFVLHFLTLILLGLIAIVASRGTIIFAFPVFFSAVALCVGITWLLMLPGAFYGVQVVRLGAKEGRLTGREAVIHGLLQFVFVADVLDTMYLAVKKWGCGKKSSLAVGGLYLISLLIILGAVLALRMH